MNTNKLIVLTFCCLGYPHQPYPYNTSAVQYPTGMSGGQVNYAHTATVQPPTMQPGTTMPAPPPYQEKY